MDLFSRLVKTTLPAVPKPIVGRFASRYVAGPSLEDAVRVVRQLNQEGAMATVDVLGEEVHERTTAEAAVEQYLQVLRTLDAEKLDANVSIKPTMLGLKLDEEFCHDNLDRLCELAGQLSNFVRIDMEDRTTTQATLRIYRRLRQRHDRVGVVLQSYMRSTLQDIEELPPRANVRLCKGIYIEPREVAWKGYETVRHNFLAALEKMFAKGIYVGIATHDEFLVCGAVALIDRFRLEPSQYEFQMLYGVDSQLRRILIAGGHRLRVYVPFGQDWYPYSVRRLRENPEIAKHVLRAMIPGNNHHG